MAQPNPARHLRARPTPWLTACCLATVCCASVAQGVVIGRVTRIHDGDTVSIQQNERRLLVRLATIDAPEADQPFGKKSRQALSACAFGRVAVVEVHGLDRHGRTLGTLEAGGRDCGLEQLRAGLAWHYQLYAHEQSSRQRLIYAAAERDARSRSLGLWAQAEPVAPWTFRRLKPPLVGTRKP